MRFLALTILLASHAADRHIEVTAPSFGFPVYFSRSVTRPQPIRGYEWFRHDHGSDLWSKNPAAGDPGWALYRLTDAPPDDRHLFRQRDPYPSVDDVFLPGEASL